MNSTSSSSAPSSRISRRTRPSTTSFSAIPVRTDESQESSDTSSTAQTNHDTQSQQLSTTRRSPIELDAVQASSHLSLAGLVPGMAVRAVSSVVGMAGMGLGYGFAKLLSGDLSNSTSFRLGGEALLYTSGIFPTVLCEDDETGQLGNLPDDDDEQKAYLRSTPIVVSNHISYIDAIMLPLVLQMPKFMSMAEVKHWPLFGVMGTDLDYIFVDRKSADSRKKTLEAIQSHVQAWRDGDRPLLIFAEGTTSNGTTLHEFRKGAFVSGKPVRPVVVKYTGSWNPANVNFREAPPEERATQDVDYEPYDDGDWAAQFAGHFDHTCVVLVCRQYLPSPEEQADPELYAKNVRKIMLARLNELHVACSGEHSSSLDERMLGLRRRLRMQQLRKSGRDGVPEDVRLPGDSTDDLESSPSARDKLRARAHARRLRVAMKAVSNFKSLSSKSPCETPEESATVDESKSV